jgi:F420-non-reducing hydrogenase small subunit
MAGTRKLQVALYWGAACGGCDVAVLDTNEFILDVAQAADIRFWPIAVDGKYQDVEAMADGELDLCLFDGAVRNSENEEVARLLRRKSKILVAFGSCASMGGIPGLANLTTREEIFERAYFHNPSLQAGSQTVPQTETEVAGGTLHLPRFYKRVYSLGEVVDVDYYVPGCPPAPAQVRDVLRAVVATVDGGALPPNGSVIGASDRAICDDCHRTKAEKKIARFHRPYEIMQDSERCLLEQGLVCMGPVTRSGCGVRCPESNMGCRGCYGPLPGVADQGARFLSALSSVIDSKDPAEINTILDGIPDFVSIAYRFSVPASLLQRSVRS